MYTHTTQTQTERRAEVAEQGRRRSARRVARCPQRLHRGRRVRPAVRIYIYIYIAPLSAFLATHPGVEVEVVRTPSSRNLRLLLSERGVPSCGGVWSCVVLVLFFSCISVVYRDLFLIDVNTRE